MKIVIDIPEIDYDLACKYPNALIATYAHYIKEGTPYEERPQIELANEVWELYEKHHSHLATHVIEFGGELKELLSRYER